MCYYMPNRNGSSQTRTAAEITAELTGPTEYFAQTNLICRRSLWIAAENLRLVDASGQEFLQTAEG